MEGGRGSRVGRPPSRLALATTILSLGLLAGCGGGPAPDAGPTASPSPTVSAADRSCRDQWASLGVKAREGSRAGVDVREAFAERWNAIAAGIDYYVQVADAGQCGDLLAARRTSIETLRGVVDQALPYDADQRRRTAFALRPVYAALPRGGREPTRVKRAFRRLSEQTPAASADLAPAYDELARADPTDDRAVAQGTSDIKLLADTSDAYRACSAALAVISSWQDNLARLS